MVREQASSAAGASARVQCHMTDPGLHMAFAYGIACTDVLMWTTATGYAPRSVAEMLVGAMCRQKVGCNAQSLGVLTS